MRFSRRQLDDQVSKLTVQGLDAAQEAERLLALAKEEKDPLNPWVAHNLQAALVHATLAKYYDDTAYHMVQIGDHLIAGA